MRTYKTQMEAAKRGIVTPEMELVAKKEYMEPETLRQLVAKGEVAIPCNIHHTSISPEGIGGGLRTKINVNLGISGDCNRYDMEMQKVDLALQFGAEAIMDLSNYGKTNTFRRELIAKSPAMIGTVPMYDAIGYLEKDLLEITPEDFLRVVRAHAEEGVDFMTIHAGINRRAVEAFMRDKRRMNIVSRGGSLLFAWMMMTGRENPFYEHYDEVLEILREYDVTISLGDALRPGCIDDSTDAGQVAELIELGSLTERAWAKDVQVMVEGPGHMAMNEIAANMQLQKRLCHNAPFYVLGPIVTDIAPGYDHITAAIGGAIAAAKRCGLPVLCDAGRASSPAGPGRREGGNHRQPHRPPMPPTSPRASPTPGSRTTPCPKPVTRWTGRPCLTLLWTRTRPDATSKAPLPPTGTPAPCVAKCARYEPPT